MRSGQPVKSPGIDFKGFYVDFDGFWAGRVPGVMAWARPGSWLDSGGGGGRGFVDPGGRGRRWEVREFVDPWGVRGFVNGFVDSWIRELVAGFVDLFARFRVRGVSFPKASAKGSRSLGNIPGKSCTIV